MVTTRRASTEITNSAYDRGTAGGVDVLERKAFSQTNEVASVAQEETIDEARARMRGNLDMLLNYDRYSEQVVDSVEAPMLDEARVAEPVDIQDEDIRPTSTTMQFGDGDVDQIYNEIQRDNKEETSSYRLNGKGKLVVVLYALAVTVILALIIINTGVLASLSGTREAKATELNTKIEQYQQLSANIEDISTNDYIIEQAEELGMVKR